MIETMPSPTWSPDQYLKFADARARAFDDLVARIHTPEPVSVVDLGCGPGNTTRTLSDRWPHAHVTGVDSSEAMIADAQHLAVEVPDGRLRFEVGDIEAWMPVGAVDVIIANAVLHWVPDHVALLPRWIEALRPGGALAFQVPAPADERGATALRVVTSAPRWAGTLAGVASPG